MKQPSATVPVPNVRLGDFERVFISSGSNVDVDLLLTPRYHSVVYQDDNSIWYQPNIVIEKGLFNIYVGGGQPDYYENTLSIELNVNSQADFYTCNNQG